ncbi:hypothetical protein BpHYR1_015260 [Brachionus plicatilis]|uniref:Uncharacterized protein n=1 Tax=Brachionus plicatilis TaxID=10195 RepID=A0A3M7Q3P0_BRAPC|nr:hypothetical protein BpHYR1_015260 [Brachionus plicatilis]
MSTVLQNGDLASGSNDGTIKIWNLENGSVKMTLNNNSDGVYSLTVLQNKSLFIEFKTRQLLSALAFLGNQMTYFRLLNKFSQEVIYLSVKLYSNKRFKRILFQHNQFLITEVRYNKNWTKYLRILNAFKESISKKRKFVSYIRYLTYTTSLLYNILFNLLCRIPSIAKHQL